MPLPEDDRTEPDAAGREALAPDVARAVEAWVLEDVRVVIPPTRVVAPEEAREAGRATAVADVRFAACAPVVRTVPDWRTVPVERVPAGDSREARETEELPPVRRPADERGVSVRELRPATWVGSLRLKWPKWPW